MLLHRLAVARATGFPGWVAAVFAIVGLTLVFLALLGKTLGLATDAVGFWGLGLFGPSHVFFGLGVTRLGWPMALAGVGLIVGWAFPLVALFVNVGAIVWIPLGAAWVLFALLNVFSSSIDPPLKAPSA
jgi:hypothetical protein